LDDKDENLDIDISTQNPGRSRMIQDDPGLSMGMGVACRGVA